MAYGVSKFINGIQYFKGYYWATPDEPDVYKSSDLDTWTISFTEPRNKPAGQLFIFKDELYLFTSGGFTHIYKTSDGVTWDLVHETERSFDGYHEMPIIVEDGKMYALSYGDGMLSTTDGVTWHFDEVHLEWFTDAVIVNGWIYGVFNNTQPEPTHVKFLASDPDGTWETSHPLDIKYEDLYKIAYYKGSWYVGDYDYAEIYKSTDFINWTVDDTLDSSGPELFKVHKDFLFMTSANNKIYIRNEEEWRESYDISIHSEDFDLYSVGQSFIDDNWYYSAYDGIARINITYPS